MPEKRFNHFWHTSGVCAHNSIKARLNFDCTGAVFLFSFCTSILFCKFLCEIAVGYQPTFCYVYVCHEDGISTQSVASSNIHGPFPTTLIKIGSSGSSIFRVSMPQTPVRQTFFFNVMWPFLCEYNFSWDCTFSVLCKSKVTTRALEVPRVWLKSHFMATLISIV